MEWLEPWVAISDLEWSDDKKAEYCSGWERQLKKEVGPRHQLRGESATLIARRFDCDDALFQLSDGRVADVHLTWGSGEEPDPSWPVAAVFQSLDRWAVESMKPQHQQWAAGGQ
jgi:hypothetical protein